MEGTLSLPASLRHALARRLPSAGTRVGDPGAPLGSFRALGGGCIHHAGRLDTASGPVFLKWNRGEAATGFTSEARSLEALRAAADPDLLDVPEVIDARDGSPGAAFDPVGPMEGEEERDAGTEEGLGWLILEYLPPSPSGPDHDARLGRGLAHLHSLPRQDFGWPETNRIGPLPQPNPTRQRWADFWVEARLLPQTRAARDEGHLGPDDVERLERVAALTPLALEPVAHDPPALVHGDLWSGTVHPGPRGRPVLVDPAAYHGHGEVDLAMARLFGGFGRDTFRTYREIRPIPDGFAQVRCPLFQLYYLLVHVRLFGASYLGQTRAAARSVLSELGRG